MPKQPHLLAAEDQLADVALLADALGRVDRIVGQCDDYELVAELRESQVLNAS